MATNAIRDPVRRGVLSRAATARLASAADATASWPAGSHVWGQYAELTPHGEVICRTENVSACHEGVAVLVDGVLRDVAAAALGEPVVAFKDKINYKPPGGAGFRPHQDRVAYPGVRRVMSVLVAIDACTTDSGCLWLADGIDAELPVDDRGVVRADVAAALDWRPVELAAGDAVCLDGLCPHYSEANRTESSRRVLVASYAAASEGYDRALYYDARHERMHTATARDGRFRISTLADFAGIETAVASAPQPAHCTHPAATRC